MTSLLEDFITKDNHLDSDYICRDVNFNNTKMNQ